MIAAHHSVPPACDERWLVVRFEVPHAVLSWAIHNGGRRTASAVAWHEVTNAELAPGVDAAKLLQSRLEAAGLAGAVGLLTSARLARQTAVAEGAWEGVTAHCVATVGLGNALRTGDPPAPARPVGTVNVLCRLSIPLGEEALVEAVSIAAEARTLAVLEAGVRSPASGAPATGTGTDCIVIAAPEQPGGARYAGKHTAIGYLIGSTVRAAVAKGASAWLEERGR